MPLINSANAVVNGIAERWQNGVNSVASYFPMPSMLANNVEKWQGYNEGDEQHKANSNDKTGNARSAALWAVPMVQKGLENVNELAKKVRIFFI